MSDAEQKWSSLFCAAEKTSLEKRGLLPSVLGGNISSQLRQISQRIPTSSRKRESNAFRFKDGSNEEKEKRKLEKVKKRPKKRGGKDERKRNLRPRTGGAALGNKDKALQKVRKNSYNTKVMS